MKRVILAIIRFYQFLSPVFRQILIFNGERGVGCKFVPSCSEYTHQAISRYGIIQGSWRGFKRIIRCHPWTKGGKDLLK